jgi:hypothetical protein
MLSSIPQQADFIVRRGSFRANHVVAEMVGLTQAALCFPEYKDASKWLDYAFGQMIRQTSDQVYPDGVQKELSGHYHKVTLETFDQYNELLKRAGREPLPELETVSCRMGNYLAYAMNPAGYLPMNNDSYHHRMADAVIKKAEDCDRSDWRYIASGGRSGQRPEGPASAVFPWARHVFMRSGWDADAHYAFFDGGPWGIAHQHYDKLHIEIFACGRSLLVDSGVFTYKGYYGTDPWRNYFISSAAHNTILVDGVGQGTSPKEYSEPMPATDYILTPDYDYAAAGFIDGYKGVMDQQVIEGTAIHTRRLLYLKNACWVVLDEIKTDRPRTIQALWHYHPDCTVEIQDRSVVSVDRGKGNLRITPVTDVDWHVERVKGRSDPNEIQGWYSPDFNEKRPASTAVFTGKISGSAAFAWVLVPAVGEVPRTHSKLISTGPATYELEVEIGKKMKRIVFTSDERCPVEVIDLPDPLP